MFTPRSLFQAGFRSYRFSTQGRCVSPERKEELVTGRVFPASFSSEGQTPGGRGAGQRRERGPERAGEETAGGRSRGAVPRTGGRVAEGVAVWSLYLHAETA